MLLQVPLVTRCPEVEQDERREQAIEAISADEALIRCDRRRLPPTGLVKTF
jgi:hypothetical protein